MSSTETFSIEARAYSDPEVQRLVAAVQAEYVVRYGGPDRARVDPGEFIPPLGLFLVGVRDAQPVATGGWRRIEFDDGRLSTGPVVEIKRMYVLDAARRQGLARRMLAELERTAAAAGVTRAVLNTGVHQPEAIALYEACGYEPIAGFGYYADYSNALFYGKRLAAGSE